MFSYIVFTICYFLEGYTVQYLVLEWIKTKYVALFPIFIYYIIMYSIPSLINSLYCQTEYFKKFQKNLPFGEFLSTSFYDLVLLNECHFHHHHLTHMTLTYSTLNSIEILMLMYWIPASENFDTKSCSIMVNFRHWILLSDFQDGLYWVTVLHEKLPINGKLWIFTYNNLIIKVLQ